MQKRSPLSHCVKLSRGALWALLRQAACPNERLQRSAFPRWEKAPLLHTISQVFALLAALSVLSGFIGSALQFAGAAVCIGTLSSRGPGSLAQQSIVYPTRECAGEQGAPGAYRATCSAPSRGSDCRWQRL